MQLANDHKSRLVVLSVPCLWLILLNTSCATVRCSPQLEREPPLIEIIHLEEGDGPTAWALRVHVAGEAEGWLVLSRMGRRNKCAALGSEKIQELQALIASLNLEAIPRDERAAIHREQIQIALSDQKRLFLASHLPNEVIPLLRAMDRWFSEEFGAVYSWPLLGPASGP